MIATREECPQCGASPLDYDSLFIGSTEINRMYWCDKCEWSLTLELPTDGVLSAKTGDLP